MPRRVDHDERRGVISDALVRVAARDGLHAVTMRSVAAEAGISVRLVQYYFETKMQLMDFAMRRMEYRSRSRWKERLERLPGEPTVRSRLEAFVAESLPYDTESRQFHLVFMAYSVLAMTEDAKVEQPFIAGPDRLESELTKILQDGWDAGYLDPTLDVPTEAAILLSLNHGLGTSILIGQRSLEESRHVLQRHLDRLFVGG